MHRDSVNGSSETDNVISLFRTNPKPTKINREEEEATPEENSFLEIMKRNRDNKARMAKERAKANQSVIRSHRLKR